MSAEDLRQRLHVAGIRQESLASRLRGFESLQMSTQEWLRSSTAAGVQASLVLEGVRDIFLRDVLSLAQGPLRESQMSARIASSPLPMVDADSDAALEYSPGASGASPLACPSSDAGAWMSTEDREAGLLLCPSPPASSIDPLTQAPTARAQSCSSTCEEGVAFALPLSLEETEQAQGMPGASPCAPTVLDEDSDSPSERARGGCGLRLSQRANAGLDARTAAADREAAGPASFAPTCVPAAQAPVAWKCRRCSTCGACFACSPPAWPEASAAASACQLATLDSASHTGGNDDSGFSAGLCLQTLDHRAGSRPRLAPSVSMRGLACPSGWEK